MYVCVYFLQVQTTHAAAFYIVGNIFNEIKKV